MNWLVRLWRNHVVGLTVDQVAKAIHDADVFDRQRWPNPGERWSPNGNITPRTKVYLCRAQARAAAKALGIKLIEEVALAPIVPRPALTCRHDWDHEQCDFPHCRCNDKKRVAS